MNIKQAIQQGKLLLTSATPQIDSEYLLAFVLKKSFTWLKTWPETLLTDEQQQNFETLLKRRAQGEPVAYITAEREFWTLKLKTNAATLIPRTETELLVELGLDFLKNLPCGKVLDLGTGTGAIALAIASERPNDQVFACDFNQQAVELAIENAEMNNIKNVKIFQSDWFTQVSEQGFNLIVANPPYIADDDPHLQQGDLVHEPLSALVAADDGYADIKTIIEQSRGFLLEGGQLIIEHGYQQAFQVHNLFKLAGYSQVTCVNDLGENERVTLGTWLKT